MLISATLKQAGYTVQGIAEQDYDQIASTVEEFRPEIIGFSMTTGRHQYNLDLVKRLKTNFSFLSIFGGPHPTYFPEIIQKEGVDIVCVGEGEFPMLELVQCLTSGKDYRHIPNLIVKRDGIIYENPPRPFLQELDLLPFQDRELFGLPEYKVFSILANRGCPYDCTYCFNHQHKKLAKGKYIRQRSVENVIAEVKMLRDRYNATRILFHDDVFILNKKWLEQFAARYPHEAGLPFLCNVRANLITRDVVALLKKAGCTNVVMGVETGNSYLRETVLNRRSSNETIIEAGRLIKEYGIELLTQNIIALPGESIEMAMDTVDINVQIKPQHMNLYFCQPYPGTILAQYSIDHGFFDANFDELSESYLARSSNKVPIKTPEMREFKLLADIFHLLVKYPLLVPYAKVALTLKRDTWFKRFWSFLVSLPIWIFSKVKIYTLNFATHEQRQMIRRIFKV
jgi:anaerobic magnesium-protoporphyrin IX monomethyl ester cyclase